MSDIELFQCKGCYGDFLEWGIGDDGYCEACRYQREANLDELTGGDHE